MAYSRFDPHQPTPAGWTQLDGMTSSAIGHPELGTGRITDWSPFSNVYNDAYGNKSTSADPMYHRLVNAYGNQGGQLTGAESASESQFFNDKKAAFASLFGPRAGNAGPGYNPSAPATGGGGFGQIYQQPGAAPTGGGTPLGHMMTGGLTRPTNPGTDPNNSTGGTMPTGNGYEPFDQSKWMDPGFDWRLAQGTKALEGSAAARGGLLSGATLKGINDYAQNQASGEYSKAYDRFTGDRGFNYMVDNNDRQFGYNAQRDDRDFNNNNLKSLMDYGFRGTGADADTQKWLAALLSQNALSSGQVGAGGTVGGTNAMNSMISQLLQQYLSQQWMNR